MPYVLVLLSVTGKGSLGVLRHDVTARSSHPRASPKPALRVPKPTSLEHSLVMDFYKAEKVVSERCRESVSVALCDLPTHLARNYQLLGSKPEIA